MTYDQVFYPYKYKHLFRIITFGNKNISVRKRWTDRPLNLLQYIKNVCNYFKFSFIKNSR